MRKDQYFILLKITISFFLLTSFFLKVSAQEKTESLSKIKLGTLQGKYEQTINLSTSDTSNYMILLFRNREYEALIDYVQCSSN